MPGGHSNLTFDAGSFRDSSGRVIRADSRILRVIFEPGAPAYEAARDAGTYEKAIPSKADPMVQQLLRRPDIFPDYTEEAFLAYVRARGAIAAEDRNGDTGRLIIRHDRRG